MGDNNNYQLPGTRIENITQLPAPTPVLSSTQRVPCYFGIASPYKSVREEEVTRGAVGDPDSLAFSAEGIHEITFSGTRRGLPDLTEGTEFNVVNDQIVWEPKIFDVETVTISDIDGAKSSGYADIENTGTLSEFVGATVPGFSGAYSATSGIAEISNTGALGEFLGTTVPAITTQTDYELDITIDGSAYQLDDISIADTDDWDDVALAIQTSLRTATGSTETVEVVLGKIKVSSITTGIASTVLIEAGTAGTGSGDLLAVITALSADYTVTLDAPVDGLDAFNGVYELDITVDGSLNQVGVPLVSGDSWTDIVGKLQTSLRALTGLTETVTIEGGNIRVTSSTVDTTSTVLIEAGTLGSGIDLLQAIDDLGVEYVTSLLAPVDGTFTPNIVGDKLLITLTSAIFSRKVEFTEIAKGSREYTIDVDYTSGSNVAVTLVGDVADLENLSIGDVLNLKSVSEYLNEGDFYYISYRYDRPVDDYLVYKEFTDWTVLQRDLGEDIPDHPLVNLCNLALNFYGVPKVAVVQLITGSVDDYDAALEAIKFRPVDDVLITHPSPHIRARVITHVNERSAPDSKRERMAWFGGPSDIEIGDNTDPDSIRGAAYMMQNKRCVFINLPRGLYSYFVPGTNNVATVEVDGQFLANAMCSYRAGISSNNPTTTLLNKRMGGLSLFPEEDYDNFYTEYMLRLAGSSSALVAEPIGTAGIRILDDLTTDNRSVERNNINIVATEDFIVQEVRRQIDSNFRGRLIKNKEAYAGGMQKFLEGLFGLMQARGYIAEQAPVIRVTPHPSRGDSMVLYYGYYAVYTHKYTDGTYEILV